MPPQPEDIDLYIWEGKSDIALRIDHALAGTDIAVIRTDASMSFPPQRDATRVAIAVVSLTVMSDARFMGQDWLKSYAVPVIWVASEERGHDSRFFPPAYSYTLPLGFSAADLRAMVLRVAGKTASRQARAESRVPRAPMIAVSPLMQRVLADAELYADCDASVLIHGETGVGKERVAQLLHERSAYARGPFVAVNCGAVPEGLFEAHFFGHAKGAFTGAVGAHKGYFEQADGGTLFLDEIGDLPLYQQVKLLRVLEQHSITRLGSTVDIPVSFRLVSASHKDLLQLVADGAFRADLYYRLAVIELDIPNLEARGVEEKQAIFQALAAPQLPEKLMPPPQWLLDRVGATAFPGNIRQLANLVERVAILVRQQGIWDNGRLDRIFERMSAVARHTPLPATEAAAASVGATARANRDALEGSEELDLSDSDRQERNRIIDALNLNGWRRQDTASELGISRKVLWEKMRKLQISTQSENIEG